MKYTRETAINEATTLIKTGRFYDLIDKCRLNHFQRVLDNPKTYTATIVYKNYKVGSYVLIAKNPDIEKVFLWCNWFSVIRNGVIRNGVIVIV